MATDGSFIEQNDRERERMRLLIERARDADLSRPVNDFWTVAGVLGHIAFWDARALFLAGKLERGQAFSESDAEPEDVSWINDSTRPLILAIPPRDAAKLAFGIAEQTDEKVAALPASWEEQGDMIRERSDGRDVRVVEPVAHELPHRPTGTWSLALVRDLSRLRGGGLDHPPRGLHGRARCAGDLFQELGGLARGWHRVSPFFGLPRERRTRTGQIDTLRMRRVGNRVWIR